MNRLQNAYMIAKAQHDSIKEASDCAEYEYCKSHNYLDESGNIAEHVWMISDEDVFEDANAGYTDPYFEDLESSKVALKEAEDALIEWGLSVMPAGLQKERELLRDRASRICKVRDELINLTFRLDARTVPKTLRRA